MGHDEDLAVATQSQDLHGVAIAWSQYDAFSTSVQTLLEATSYEEESKE